LRSGRSSGFEIGVPPPGWLAFFGGLLKAADAAVPAGAHGDEDRGGARAMLAMVSQQMKIWLNPRSPCA